jgi:Leucine-rich repeat (LRR) protein
MYLDLSFNRLKGIDLSPLAKCPDLQTLHLYENKLESLDLGPLGKCKKLRQLSLKLNELSILDLSPLISSPAIKKMTFDGDVTLVASSDKKTKKMPPALNTMRGMIEWK